MAGRGDKIKKKFILLTFFTGLLIFVNVIAA